MLHAWTADNLTMCPVSPGFLDQHAAELVQLVLATLPEYHDSPSQHAVVAFLQQALSNEIFTKTLAGALVKMPGSKSSPQVQFAYAVQMLQNLLLSPCQVSCVRGCGSTLYKHGACRIAQCCWPGMLWWCGSWSSLPQRRLWTSCWSARCATDLQFWSTLPVRCIQTTALMCYMRLLPVTTSLVI